MTTMNRTASAENKKKKKSPWSIRLPAKTDIWILLAVFALAVFGMLMVGSASMGKFKEYSMTSLAIATLKPGLFDLAGYLMMAWMAAHFKLDDLKTNTILGLMVVTFAALVLCLAFPAANNARAWIRIPLPIEVTIQPSEFAKITSILIIAAYFGDLKRPARNLFQLLAFPCGVILAYVGFIVVAQNDTGSGAVIFLISCVCLLIPNYKQLKPVQVFLIVCFWAAVAFLIFMIVTPQGEAMIDSLPLQPYQKYRFTSAINPFADEHGYGYQLISGLTAFAGGGLFGRGFGNSIQKYMNFPQAESDYILSILVEELGFAGFAFMLFLYCVIIFRLLAYALKIRNEKARIILTGTAMYFVFHIFLNIGGVTGMIPLTGVPLPLISAGSSAAMSVMLALGICQAIISSYRKGELE